MRHDLCAPMKAHMATISPKTGITSFVAIPQRLDDHAVAIVGSDIGAIHIVRLQSRSGSSGPRSRRSMHHRVHVPLQKPHAVCGLGFFEVGYAARCLHRLQVFIQQRHTEPHHTCSGQAFPR